MRTGLPPGPPHKELCVWPVRTHKCRHKRASEEVKRAAQQAEANKWTIARLSEAYFDNRPLNKGKDTDTNTNRYEKYLEKPFGTKEPKELIPLDVDRLRINLLKKLAPQTVKHVLNLLTWIINYGVKKNLCDGIPFHIQKPTVHNVITEDLTDCQLKALLTAIENYSNIQISNLMKMALYTGMRRGELFKLKWDHIDFQRNFISIVDPKGGPNQKIPLNDSARKLLENHPRPKFKVKGKKTNIRTAHLFFRDVVVGKGCQRSFKIEPFSVVRFEPRPFSC